MSSVLETDEEWDALRARAEAVVSPWARFAHLFAFDDDVDAGPPADEVLLRRMRDCEALITQLTARQGRDLLELRRRRLAVQQREHPHPEPCRTACCDQDGWVRTEVAPELGLSERQVGMRIETALSLVEHPRVAQAVDDGRLQVWTATKLLDYLDMLAVLLPPQRVERIEAATVAWLLASPRTVAQLSARMRRLLLRARASAGSSDSTPAAASRQVRVQPADEPGMAEVLALLPEADALAVRACLDAVGAFPVAPDDGRTASQRRADLLVCLVTGAQATGGHAEDVAFAVREAGRVEVRLDVTIPIQSLQGGCEPAEVPGYGTIPAEAARRLACGPHVSSRPLVYDGATGRLVGFGSLVSPRPSAPAGDSTVTWLDAIPPSSGYQHSATLDAAIRARDGHCRAPGCSRRAVACDCDHVVPYPQGPTSLQNSCALCRRHHRLKTHAAGWCVQMTDAVLQWTTPAGQSVVTRPFDYRPAADEPEPDEPEPGEPDEPPF